MGKLNILHHKEWHVYSRANREIVQKDEEKASIENKAKQIRNDQAVRGLN